MSLGPKSCQPANSPLDLEPAMKRGAHARAGGSRKQKELNYYFSIFLNEFPCTVTYERQHNLSSSVSTQSQSLM